MTSTIRTNMDAVRAHNVFESNNAKMSKAFTKVSTGMRINSVQDNPSNWAISEKMRERINSLNQAQQNVQNDTAMIKTAENGILNTVDILRDLKEKVIHAADASVTDNDRLNIAKELKNLMDQIDYNAANTRYNGKLLLYSGGTDKRDDVTITDSYAIGTGSDKYLKNTTDGVSLKFQIGADNGGLISGVTIGNMGLQALGLSDSYEKIYKLAANTDINLRPSDLIRATDNTATNVGTNYLIAKLDAALTTALGNAVDVGSLEQRLGYTADNVATQIENLEASDSAIRDSDMAKEIADYMKWSVLSQASQYMLAQSNQNAFSVLNLLQ